jgi:hypothetical protein
VELGEVVDGEGGRAIHPPRLPDANVVPTEEDER